MRYIVLIPGHDGWVSCFPSLGNARAAALQYTVNEKRAEDCRLASSIEMCDMREAKHDPDLTATIRR